MEIEPQTIGEIAHWIAAPMKDVGTFEQFHEVVEYATRALEQAQRAPRDNWQPINTAPKDGSPIDLWIAGRPSSIEFLTTQSTMTPDSKSLHGRICDWCWISGDWRIRAGLQPLSGLRMFVCVATHWMSRPEPPRANGQPTSPKEK